MGFNFKKISAIGSSLLLAGMSVALPVAAANYPAPFVEGGAANVAIVYGTGTGVSILDAVEAGNIQSDLQARMSTKSTGTGGSVTGEAVALFTGGTKMYINDTLNVVKSVLTKSDLPTVLASSDFSGNVDATITQTIDIGSNPRVLFKRQPTSSDDPNYALTTSTTQANYIYNTTATFSKAVEFNNSNSEGQSLTLFGMPVTIGSATDADTLVLLKSAAKVDLSSDSPTQDVTIAGASYTVELVSASDTAATIAVTNSAGVRESKEVNEAATKKINGVSIAVINADETNLKLSASIIAGSDKITLEDGASVKIGESDTSIDGTLVDFETGTPGNLTALTISVYASESDKDAIKAGGSFVDPVYGSFKLDFSGFNIDTESTAREAITVTPNGDDKMDISFTDYRGLTKSFQWSKDIAGNVIAGYRGGAQLMVDSDNRNMTVLEMGNITYQGYVVVGNEGEGYLLKLSGVKNSSQTGSSNTDGDRAEFTDVFSGEVIKTSWKSDGVGDLIVGGKTFTVRLEGDANAATEDFGVHLDYPDSSGTADLVLFPTIKTNKGAKIAFYKPTEVFLQNVVRVGSQGVANTTTIRVPDGDGYETATIQIREPGVQNASQFNVTVDGTTTILNVTGAGEVENGVLWSVEGLTFNITNKNLTASGAGTQAANSTTIYLVEPDGGGNINQSALIVWEEKDDNSRYHASIILLETGRSGDDGLGVDTSGSGQTWHNNSAAWQTSRASDSKKTDAADLWGTIITYDTSDSDQPKATISYPDEQVYAQLYIAEDTATITAGTSGTTTVASLGEVLVKDSEVASVSTKNLVIVGGSCINSAAATVLGGAYCGQAFTDATDIAAGQFMIKGVMDKFATGKLALVVAGYNVADTVNAAKYLRTQTVDTSKEYTGTSSTSATLKATTA